MSTQRFPILNRFLWRLTGNPALAPASPVSKRERTPPVRIPQAGMKAKAPEVPIQTYSIQKPQDYGALSLSAAEIRKANQELDEMRSKHVSEILTPIKSYNSGLGSGFSEQANGIGLTSNFARQAAAEYDARIAALRRELQPNIDQILPLARTAKSPPIVMAHTLQPI